MLVLLRIESYRRGGLAFRRAQHGDDAARTRADVLYLAAEVERQAQSGGRGDSRVREPRRERVVVLPPP